MSREPFKEITASFTAACVLHLRNNCETDEEYRAALEVVLNAIVNAMGNVVIELDRDGCGDRFRKQLGKHFFGALDATVEILRDFRARYHEEKETVN